MKHGFGVVAVVTMAMCAWTAAAAVAEPVEATLSLTVNALNGKHEVDRGHSDRIDFLPLPLGELTLRHGSDSIRIEGLPPVTFGYRLQSTAPGPLSTRLSIVNATYRRAFAGGWFAGVGQTVYNQFGVYPTADGSFFYQRGLGFQQINGEEDQFSRVTGARFEAGRVMRHGRDTIDVSAAVNPRMRGIQYTRIPTNVVVCRVGNVPCIQQTEFTTFSDPENASQVDLAARVAHPLSKHAELLYGLRYLNYTAHYDDFAGQLADRNVGIAPLLGLRVKL